jgi:hypothetical protein
MCSTAAVRALASRAAQGLYLLRALAEHNLGRLAARLDPGPRASLGSLRLREWVTGEEGEALAAQLISALVSEHLTATGECRTRRPILLCLALARAQLAWALVSERLTATGEGRR